MRLGRAASAVLLGVATTASPACGPVCEARICAIMGTGELGFNGDGLDGLETRLASPTSVGVDPSGRPMVVDYSNMRVRLLRDDGTVQTLVGNGIHAYSEPGAAPLDTPLENPVDAAWGADGLLYVLPQHEGRVIRIEDGVVVCAGTGAIGDSGDGGDALDAQMGYGGGLALGADGAMYVSDNTWSRVRRIDPDGRIDTILGIGEAGLGAPGHGPEVAIRNPERIVLDPSGSRLLVADTGNHRVLAVDLATLEATLVAGSGERGYRGDGGPAREAALDRPMGLEVTEAGGVLIADFGNDAIRHVHPDGTLTTVAGGIDDEPARADDPLDFAMDGPAGLALTAEGDLLVAERTGQRVLRWRGARDAL